MLRLAGLLLLWTLGLLTGQPATAELAPSATPPLVLKKGIEVVHAEFGLFNDEPEPDKPTFVPASVVPYVPDQAYGWVVTFNTPGVRVHWKEEFTLPAAPATWGESHEGTTQRVSPDRRTSVKEADATLPLGVLSNSWTVAPGDPKGRYVIRLFIDGKLVRTFEFEVR